MAFWGKWKYLEISMLQLYIFVFAEPALMRIPQRTIIRQPAALFHQSVDSEEDLMRAYGSI